MQGQAFRNKECRSGLRRRRLFQEGENQERDCGKLNAYEFPLVAAAERPVRFPGYMAKYSRQVGVGRLYYLRVWHCCTAAGCCAHSGCPRFRKYGGNLQSIAGETRGWSECWETALWSFWELSHLIYKLKANEYFELPSVNVLEEGS